MLRIFCTDLDGTLLNKESRLSERTRKDIQKILEKGIIVVLCSGRSFREIEPFISDLSLDKYQTYLVYSSGNGVYDVLEKKHYHQNTLSNEEVSEIVSAVKNVGIFYQLESNETIARFIRPVTEFLLRIYGSIKKGGFDSYPENVVKYNNEPIKEVDKIIVHDYPYMASFSKCFIEKKLNSRYEIIFSAEDVFEIMKKGSGKLNGLNKVLELCHGSLDEVMACGDQENDIDVLQAAGLSIAVSNAKKTVKMLADEVTLSNNEDGIAMMIEKYLLKEGSI